MSKSTPFLAPILLVLLQTNTTFALKCYGCLATGDVGPSSPLYCDRDPEDLVVDQRDRNSKLKDAAQTLTFALVHSGVKLDLGRSCFEFQKWEDGASGPTIVRYFVQLTPEDESLDEFGCLYDEDKARYCFCNNDLCNLDMLDQDAHEEEDESGSEEDGQNISGGGVVKPTKGPRHKPTGGGGMKPKKGPGDKPNGGGGIKPTKGPRHKPSGGGGIKPTKAPGHKPKRGESFVDQGKSACSSPVSFTMPSLFLLTVPTLITCYITRR